MAKGKPYFFGKQAAAKGDKKKGPMATALAGFRKKGAFGRKGQRKS